MKKAVFFALFLMSCAGIAAQQQPKTYSVEEYQTKTLNDEAQALRQRLRDIECEQQRRQDKQRQATFEAELKLTNKAVADLEKQRDDEIARCTNDIRYRYALRIHDLTATFETRFKIPFAQAQTPRVVIEAYTPPQCDPPKH